jgi:rubrerythrin
MTVDVSSLTVEKALSMAVKSEKDATEAYIKLQSMVKNFILRDKLRFLAEEEQKHQKLLKEVHKKVAGGREPPETERSLAPRLTIALQEKSSVTDLLELAMDAEKISEEFYDNLSQNVEERGLQEILQYLASMEHGHYFLLKGEYELCMKDEAYYDREDFQYDMVHIGP